MGAVLEQGLRVRAAARREARRLRNTLAMNRLAERLVAHAPERWTLDVRLTPHFRMPANDAHRPPVMRELEQGRAADVGGATFAEFTLETELVFERSRRADSRPRWCR